MTITECLVGHLSEAEADAVVALMRAVLSPISLALADVDVDVDLASAPLTHTTHARRAWRQQAKGGQP